MQELHELKLLARAAIPWELIAFELQRTEESSSGDCQAQENCLKADQFAKVWN
jgi:hypothetical protein